MNDFYSANDDGRQIATQAIGDQPTRLIRRSPAHKPAVKSVSSSDALLQLADGAAQLVLRKQQIVSSVVAIGQRRNALGFRVQHLVVRPQPAGV